MLTLLLFGGAINVGLPGLLGQAVGVAVGVGVRVIVGVSVGVLVRVDVGVGVRVSVGVRVCVGVKTVIVPPLAIAGITKPFRFASSVYVKSRVAVPEPIALKWIVARTPLLPFEIGGVGFNCVITNFTVPALLSAVLNKINGAPDASKGPGVIWIPLCAPSSSCAASRVASKLKRTSAPYKPELCGSWILLMRMSTLVVLSGNTFWLDGARVIVVAPCAEIEIDPCQSKSNAITKPSHTRK